MTSLLLSSAEVDPAKRPNDFTAHQKHVQQIITVTFASISVLSALLTFYWFFNIKKVYRHQLIMLLVASGGFKSMWYLVPAIKMLVHERPFSTRLCQGFGFLLQLGLETADFAILLIAIHTALTVLRSRKSVGLQHYRYPAYACCAVLAILMAALAFVNSDEQHSYISQGTFCWLPVRPIWYRLTFSWVPRYFILCTIIAIYGTIYVYTVRQFGKFNTTITTSTQASNTASGEVHDGLADPSPGSRTSHWFWQSGDGPPESENERQDLTSRSDSARVAGSSGQYHQSTFPPSERVERRPTLLQALRDKTLLIKNRDPTDSNSNNALHKQHKAIQRQLRYMFIYPLVYLLMWIAPFINHCYFYTRQHDPPFVLSCISLVSVCLQCAADCLIFCLRERPWEQSVHGHSGRDKRRSIDESFKDSIELADIDGAAGVPSQAPETGGIRNVVKPPVVRQFRKDKNWWDGENI